MTNDIQIQKGKYCTGVYTAKVVYWSKALKQTESKE